MSNNHYEKYILPNAIQLANTELNLAHRGIDQQAKLAHTGNHGIFSLYRDVRIESVFQPIIEFTSAKLIGFEATARIKKIGGHATPIPYKTLTQYPSSPLESIYLDRLLRIQHTLNYIIQGAHHNARLFLNVSPMLLLAISAEHGHFFRMLAQSCGVRAGEVVLEFTLTEPITDQHVRALESYRSNGFAIALDGVNRGWTTVRGDLKNIIRAIQPDIVKINISSFSGADGLAQLTDWVTTARQNKAIVVGTHLEMPQGKTYAHLAKADWGQGFLVAHPHIKADFKSIETTWSSAA